MPHFDDIAAPPPLSLTAAEVARFDAIAKYAKVQLGPSAADVARFAAVAKAASSPIAFAAAEVARFDAIAKYAKVQLSPSAVDVARFAAVAKAASSPTAFAAADVARFDAIAKYAKVQLGPSAADVARFDAVATALSSRPIVTADISRLSNAILTASPSHAAWANISASDLWAGCKEVAKSVLPLDVNHDWADRLYDRALRIDRPWVLQNRPMQSFEGFARIIRLNDATRSVEFDVSSKLFQNELGQETNASTKSLPNTRDVIAVGRGFAEELISFADDSFEDVISAGFSIRIDRCPTPEALNGQAVLYETESHRSLLMELEMRLRQFIVRKLRSKYGENWLEFAVSGNKSRPWKRRLFEDELSGRPTFDLIHYVDFWDLHDIIVDPKNWQIFVSSFKQTGDFTASMARLRPIRHSIAHARPLGKADTITIICEVARLMAAMGVNVIAD